MTRAELMGVAAIALAVFVADLVIDNRDTDPQPDVRTTPPEEEYPTEILSDDLGEWDATGSGTLAATTKNGETVWTATGSGRVTWPQSVADLVMDFGFQFPNASVDAGVVVRIPDSGPGAGVEVQLDLNDDGSARVGNIAGLVDPLIYVEPRPKEWHSLRVTVIGERVVVHVDDRHIVDWVDLEPGEGRMVARGKVALRFSDGIRFRSVELAGSSGSG